MISDELKNIIKQLNGQGQTAFVDAASEEQISEFEKKYGISFPSKYREWLLYHDGGEFFLPAGVQFFGVAHNPLIDVNDDDRPDDSYIVIGSLANGDPVLFKRSEETIAIYNHDAGIIEHDEIYKDFFDFLNDLYDLLGIGE